MSFYHCLICTLTVLKFLWHSRLSCLNNNPLAAPLSEEIRVKPCLNKACRSLLKHQQSHFGGSGVVVITSIIIYTRAMKGGESSKQGLQNIVLACIGPINLPMCGSKMWNANVARISHKPYKTYKTFHLFHDSMTILHHPRHHGHNLEDLHHVTRVRVTRIECLSRKRISNNGAITQHVWIALRKMIHESYTCT